MGLGMATAGGTPEQLIKGLFVPRNRRSLPRSLDTAVNGLQKLWHPTMVYSQAAEPEGGFLHPSVCQEQHAKLRQGIAHNCGIKERESPVGSALNVLLSS